MPPKRLMALIAFYQTRLLNEGVPKERMSQGKSFGRLVPKELLAHAHFVCNEAINRMLAKNFYDARWRLTEIQICLSSVDWYTAAQIDEHNRSGPPVSGLVHKTA